jgi:hypothetical protein
MLTVGASSASAHVAKPSDSTHYRSAVTGVAPAQQLFSVQVGRLGDWVELTAKTDQPLIVVGYFGEPYLRVTSTQTQVNAFAPTAQMNGGLIGSFGPTQLDDATTPPHWIPQSLGPTVRWRDLRTQWIGGTRPPDVGADPGHSHFVGDWSITVQGGGVDYAIDGTLKWTAIRRGMSPGLIAFFAVDTIALGAGALLIRRRVGSRRAPLPPASAALVSTPASFVMPAPRGR